MAGRGTDRGRRKKTPPFLPGDAVEFLSSEGGGTWKPGTVVEWVVLCSMAEQYSRDPVGGVDKYMFNSVRICVGDGVCVVRPKEKVRMANLPIDIVTGSSPTKFSWRQTVEDLEGRRRTVQCEGTLPPGVEGPVADLVALAKRLAKECESAHATIKMAVDRLGGQVEGRPTHEGNFLQRVDELVAVEVRTSTDKPHSMTARKGKS